MKFLKLLKHKLAHVGGRRKPAKSEPHLSQHTALGEVVGVLDVLAATPAAGFALVGSHAPEADSMVKYVFEVGHVVFWGE